jgi:Cu+-exporting ATPase
LSTPVVLWGGWPFFIRGWQSIINRRANMFTLITLGIGISYGYSVVAILFADMLPSAFGMKHGSPHVYFEGATMITTLVILGQILELKARTQASSSIKALLSLSPKTARLLNDDGSETDVELKHVRVGDKLRIRPGETIPVDGVVLTGLSTINESMITGEAIPVEKASADKLIGGTINQTGSLTMKATSVGYDTVLGQIIQLVSQAQRSQAPVQKLVDNVSAFFVPTIILIAVVVFFCWLIMGPEPSFMYAVLNSVAVLIIACPCALGLATPMSVMVAVSHGARAGILIKKAEALQILDTVNTIIVDKTGTLTEGKPRLKKIMALPGFDENEILQLAASIEHKSEHPFANAIVLGAIERELPITEATNFKSSTGKGIKGTVDSYTVCLGNKKIFSDLNIDIKPLELMGKAMQMDGSTVIFIAVDNKPAGIISIVDPIKNSAKKAIEYMQSKKINVVLLSGDNSATAQAVANMLGIDEVHADVLPSEKVEVVKSLQQEGRIVAMAGDGINDAPALAQANVGIAMGTGTDVAIHSASIVLVKGDLVGLLRAKKLAQAMMKNIRENLILAFGYNLLAIPIAAGLLYPFTGLLLNPMLASAAMSLSSISVIINALRLRYVRLY